LRHAALPQKGTLVETDTGRGHRQTKGKEDTGPAAPGQEEVWLSCALDDDAPRFAVSIVLDLRGRPNVPLLEQALSALVARHEVLRTTYHAGIDGLVQHVGQPWAVRIAYCDLSALDGEVARVVGAAIRKAEARAPFDVRNGPVLRARLIKLGAESLTCLFTVHHIAIDGWSMGIFARELEAIHGAYHRGEQPALQALTLRYMDFAKEQKQRAAAQSRRDGLEAVRERFRVQSLVFNIEKRCPEEGYLESDRVKLRFPQRMNEQLAAFGRAAKATRFAIFTAVLWIVLYASSRRSSFVMAADYANRSDPESGAVMGLFVTQILLRGTIDLNATFMEVIRLAQRELQQALSHAESPVSDLLPGSSDPKAPPFRVKLAFQPRIDYPRLANVDVTAVDVWSEWAKFDLLFSVHAETDLTSWDLQYRKAMFNKPDMTAMLEDIETLTRLALERPQASVESLLGEAAGLRGRRDKSRLGALKKDLLGAVSVDVQGAVDGPVALTDSGSMAGVPADRLRPWLVRARVRGVSLKHWVESNKALIEETLRTHRAILFRDFHVAASEFQAVSAELMGELMNYVEGATPREKKSAWTYSSTQFPQNAEIDLHNELSSSMTFPGRIAFYCVKPAATGGHTPLADVHQVYSSVPEHVREPFERHGWMLVRNFQKGFGLSWQQAFGTQEKSAVEDHCRNHEIECVWEDDGHLRLRQVRPATLIHPGTGLPVWFNHIAFWHESSLESDLRTMLLNEYGRNGLPFNTYYGDGSPIDTDAIEQIHSAYRQAYISFPWQSNDLLYLDNIGTAHGRTAYTGAREVRVSMGQPHRRETWR
jgi:alpha-ketoglutarate-dependent taurine dioxygenase